MKTIFSEELAPAIGPYSHAMEVNGFIYTSGQIGTNLKGELVADDIVNQTHQVMKNLFYLLEAANAHFNDVVKSTIYLTNMEDFDKVNGIYMHYFGMHKPARSTVAVKSLPKGALIEIECVAVAGANYNY
jgi:2-iminobutanoate/2-iminopropanoate deaminase